MDERPSTQAPWGTAPADGVPVTYGIDFTALGTDDATRNVSESVARLSGYHDVIFHHYLNGRSRVGPPECHCPDARHTLDGAPRHTKRSSRPEYGFIHTNRILEAIRHHPTYDPKQPIRLLACYAGVSTLAKYLAMSLEVVVVGPSDTVGYFSVANPDRNGRLIPQIATTRAQGLPGSPGRWVAFNSEGDEVELSIPLRPLDA